MKELNGRFVLLSSKLLIQTIVPNLLQFPPVKRRFRGESFPEESIERTSLNTLKFREAEYGNKYIEMKVPTPVFQKVR